MTPINIVGLAGSSNPHSSTLYALDRTLDAAREAGAEVIRFDVFAMDLPLYRYGARPASVEPFIEAVRRAHGMIWCSPLYHGTVPGSFKNAIDWLELLSGDDPPYLTNKVVALMATASGDQALQAINTMEFIVRALRGWTLPLTAPVTRSDEAFDASGQPRDPVVGERLLRVGRELTRAAAVLSRGV